MRVLFSLASVAALGSLSIDLYISAFPRIGQELGASETWVQATLTGTLIGFAVGQLVLGPVTDRFGRRRPLLIANAVLMLTALVCAAAPDVTVLVAARVVQGVACAAGVVVATATVRDLYQGAAFIKAIGHVLAVTAAVPVLAPTVGGLLLSVMSWRGLFVVIGALTVAASAAYVLWVPEGPIVRRRTVGRSRVIAGYRYVLRDRRYVGLTLVTIFVWGGAAWTYITTSPFVFQSVWGLTEAEYGLAFGINALCGWVGVQLGSRIRAQVSGGRVVGLALAAVVVVTTLLWVSAMTGALGLLGVMIPIALLYLAAGVMTPHITHLSLERLGDAAGAATALPGAATLVMAAVVAPVAGMFGSTGVVAMASVMLVAVLAGALVFHLRVRPHLGSTG
ncbi:multidrug effflux MFS transporter [Pseudactinotalea suaedae]|uniref:multidrug effflux MFS transporter n=1 Tax=Pseudactinotalea suaedae TaxID=1524924 RepID=UPI001390D74E|nr:multidrug effflux MFS transporter [Pseudactinotalea suaedae]